MLWLPNWLYGALPFGYILVGGATIFSLQGNLAIVSGVLLIVAGIIIWNLRREYRNAERRYSDGQQSQARRAR
jgi:hypothetical protein